MADLSPVFGAGVVPLSSAHFSQGIDELVEALADDETLLLIQDLDGVCMGLVRDPLTRVLERRYLLAARELHGHFFVLTNGEHIGRRGVNRLVEAAAGGVDAARDGRLYLPGLGGGGVQLQDARGFVTHPGISREELDFLAGVPARLQARLHEILIAKPFNFSAPEARKLVEVCVLDNAVSPTLNLNPLYEALGERSDEYRLAQSAARGFLEAELDAAADACLGDAFFLHFAPNRGRDELGVEIVKEASHDDPGTTDFQFMLRGAVKEAGVLVLLNRYYGQHFGLFPLGEDFSVRDAPADRAALVDLAADRFDAAVMPRIVGVGDTVTSILDRPTAARGGSDRGFLQLVQDLGQTFGTNNLTVFVDSSGGEVRRPGVRGDLCMSDGDTRWDAVAGISDRHDPLRLNYAFRGGHRQYVDFFCELAARRTQRADPGRA
ncbi:MAG: glucosylglycerol 3-phosphatase [Halieaceae bacterium]|jgi:glucosylglycerol 3-phosphatase|nr:glucosylglycerol 3-phosphatase [Halieaceae bacterium]